MAGFAVATFLFAVAVVGLVGAVFFVVAAFRVPGFVIMVVPALVLLPSLVLPPSFSFAVMGRLACRLGARVGLEVVCADIGRGGYVFSMGFIGDCGKLRELCDLGDRTPAGPAFRARVAFEFAVTTVLVLFFGFGMSWAD